MKELFEALKQNDPRPPDTELVPLMNHACDLIIERGDQAQTSEEEYIAAINGVLWNSPKSPPDKLIAQHYDGMLTLHPAHPPGTPTARIRYFADHKHGQEGKADPILVGRLLHPVFSVERRVDENDIPYYLGKHCLLLADVTTAEINHNKNLSKYLPDDAMALSAVRKVIKIPELRVCLSSTRRDVASARSGGIENISEIAYGWNQIMYTSDLSGDKYKTLSENISAIIDDWKT